MTSVELYTHVSSCPLQCADVIRDQHTNIPRGYYSNAQPGESEVIMLVAQNPGQPMKIEAQAYAGLSADQQARAHLAFVRRCAVGNEGKVFHTRLRKWMAELLSVPEEQVYDHVILTNAVKCTTPGNRCPSRLTETTCISRHLTNEIAAWQPRIVIALGLGAKRMLDRSGLVRECNYLPHPSHREGKSYHHSFLEAIKRQLTTRCSGPVHRVP